MAVTLDPGQNESISRDSTPVTATPFTTSIHFNTSASDSDMALTFLGDKDAPDRHYISQITSGNVFNINTRDSDTTANQDAGAVSTSTWYSGVGVYTNDTDRVPYLDGVAGAGAPSTDGAVSPINEDRIALGRALDSSPDRPFQGDLAEFALWNIALSTDHVQSLAGGCPPPMIRPDALVSYLSLRTEGGGTQTDFINQTSWTESAGIDTAAHPSRFRPFPVPLLSG